MDLPAPAVERSVRSHRIDFPALGRRIACREDETIHAAARRAGLRIVAACGGRGTCGSCVVRVEQGRVHRDGEGSHRKWLRSCRLKPRSDLVLELAPRSLAPVVRTDVHAGDADGVLPLALTDALRARAAARPGEPLPGLAVDLGTTNAAAWLVDLKTGRRLASLGIENPQTAWGADLVSRINHAIASPDGAAELRTAALAAVNALAHDLTRAVGLAPEQIVDVVVCGNTAMQHLLAGWPVAQLGRAPFVAATLAAVDAPARAFGVQVADDAMLHLAPSVGGFVGGDHLAALLATEALWSQPGTTAVMDIGTNTEISLVRDGRIVSASCPSGPALEGGHIACGMRAAEGAIERVAWDGAALALTVIGRRRPVGLCGSGVLDALAACLRAGWIDARGRIADGARLPGVPALASVDGVRAITLAEAAAGVPAVRLTQPDVRAVQLAKSAIRTGTQLLAAETGIDEAAIDRFVIAGAFGAYIDVASALAIGLLPPLPRARFVQVGNAAGLGVQQMLASTERRARAAELARRCRYVCLSARGDFQKTFLQQIGFPPP